ncbi:protein-L-isoaspartate O-methyltransferas-like protein [Aulographum hederae CBS 113979]|uniref:Protein-L-isoaspartate O-methyltransferase n=1 Tax=Aulographum hederae CBS 113979 TaxID=1176131 RepID=A0A6G1H4W8_9PEZI|nr:protein-L-isoaspartate O-methyltransferas-like protein [Aulographum hederae CBS 113979]
MAWWSSGSTNEELVSQLQKHGQFKDNRIKEAMRSVDRAHYAPRNPYEDSPQSIGYAATISAPHMHAIACEKLLDYLKPGAKVLDIGSGSGYLTHVLAELVKPGGTVVGIDHIQELVDMSNNNMAKSAEGRELLKSGAVKFITGDGRLGWPGEGPYDVIHVGAAAGEHYEAFVDQLKAPGRLFVPVDEGTGMQNIYITDKRADGSVERKKKFGVQYVPLTDAPKRS